MILLVQSKTEVQFGEHTNLEVKGINTKTEKETSKTIFSTLKDKWDLVQENKPIDLVMKNNGTPTNPKWQVIDIKAPPSILTSETPQTPPASTTGTQAPKPDIRSLEIEQHVWWKIVSSWAGNADLMYYIEQTFKSGKTFRKAITLACITKMLQVLPVTVEDKVDEKEKPAED